MLKHEAHIIARMSLIDEMTPAVGNMNKKLKGTAKQASAVKQQMKFMRGGMGQVGHQVQDIAVQLQMGQNKMLVFGQQGSQIASLFGPHGAIIGAVLAVSAALATSFMPSLFGASKALKAVKDESSSLIDSFDDLSPALKAIAIAQAKKEIDGLTKEMKSQEKEIKKLTSRNENLTGQMKRNKKTQKELDKATQEYKDNIVLLAAAKDKLVKKTDNSSDAFEKQEKALNKEAATLGMSASALALYEISLMNITPAQKISLANLRLSNIARQEEIDLAKESAKALTKETEALKKREEGLAKVIADMNKKKMADQVKEDEKATREFRDTYRPIFNEFGDGFVDAITGAEKFSDAIRDMAKNVIDSLLRIAVQKLIIDSLFGKFEDAFFSSSGPTPKSVSSLNANLPDARSMFTYDGGGFTGYGSRSGGVDHKGGFPAILHPNETVIDHTKGQSSGVVVQQTINVTTGVQQTVRAEIVQLMPQIAQAAKGAVADARLRGGNFSKAMGGA